FSTVNYTFIVYSSTNVATADAGIYTVNISNAFDPNTFAISAEHIMTINGVGYGNLSSSNFASAAPVVLDLDGDGVELVSQAAGVTYDYGFGLVATGWVGPDDGLLAHQTAGGLDIVFTDDAPGAATDLE